MRHCLNGSCATISSDPVKIRKRRSYARFGKFYDVIDKGDKGEIMLAALELLEANKAFGYRWHSEVCHQSVAQIILDRKAKEVGK